MFSVLVTLATTALAVVLLVSGIAKLGRSAETLRAMHELRVPAALRRLTAARALPALEIALAAGLLVAPAPLFTAIVAAVVVLFALFLALTAGAVARHESVDCNCFGAASSAPVGPLTVVRNAALVVVALAVAAVSLGDGAGAGIRMSQLAPSELTLFFALTSGALALWLVLGTVRRSRAGGTVPAAARAVLTAAATTATAAMQAELPSSTVRDGSEWPVPDLEITSPDGRAVPLVEVARERPVLLVLLSAECTPCTEVVSRLEGWREGLSGAVDVAVLTSASPGEFAQRHPSVGVPVYFGYRSLMAAAGIAGVPSALLLGTNRMVAAGPAQGLDEVVEMTEAVVGVVRSQTLPA